MAIAVSLLYYVLITKIQTSTNKIFILALLCGILFASDVAVWNIAIQTSSAQASLLTNLSPLWVGIILCVFEEKAGY
jgi:drug/metabolite transporter (DMT)-like permease